MNGGGNEVAAVNTEVSGFNIAPMNSVRYTVCVFKNDADVRNIFPTCIYCSYVKYCSQWRNR